MQAEFWCCSKRSPLLTLSLRRVPVAVVELFGEFEVLLFRSVESVIALCCSMLVRSSNVFIEKREPGSPC